MIKVSNKHCKLLFTSAQLVQPYSVTGAVVCGGLSSLAFLNSGYTRPGLDIAIASNIPLGGGLSSSSALSIATAGRPILHFLSSQNKLSPLPQFPFDPVTISKMAQKVEHELARSLVASWINSSSSLHRKIKLCY